MRYLILILLLFPVALQSQVADLTLADGTRFGINLSEIKFVVSKDGGYTVRYSDRLAAAEVSGNVLNFYNAYCTDFGLFITPTDSLVINKKFVSRVFDDGNGGSVLLTKRFRYSFQTTTPYASAVLALKDGCVEYPDNNLYYISEGGDDATALKDNEKFPWLTNSVFLEDETGVPLYVFKPGQYVVDTAGSPGTLFGTWAGLASTDITFVPTDSANILLETGSELFIRGEVDAVYDPIFGDQFGSIAANHNIWGPDATLREAYSGSALSLSYRNHGSEVRAKIGKVIVEEPNYDGFDHNAYSNTFDFGNKYSDIEVDEITTTGGDHENIYYLNFPDDSYHKFKVRRHYVLMDTLGASRQTGLFYYGSNTSPDDSRVDRAYFDFECEEYVIDYTNAAGYTGIGGGFPSEYVGRIFSTGGSRGYFTDSYVNIKYGRVSYIDPGGVFNTLPGPITSAGGLFINRYSNNTEIFAITPNLLTRTVFNLSLGQADFSGRGTPFYFSAKSYTDSKVNIDLGNVRGNDIVVSMLQTIDQGTVWKVHCDYCVAENGPALGFDGTVSDSAKLVISGTWVTEAVGAPAIVISNAGTGQVILKDVTVINDGTVASIQADVAQTITVSGVFDVNTIIPDADITIVRNDY